MAGSSALAPRLPGASGAAAGGTLGVPPGAFPGWPVFVDRIDIIARAEGRRSGAGASGRRPPSSFGPPTLTPADDPRSRPGAEGRSPTLGRSLLGRSPSADLGARDRRLPNARSAAQLEHTLEPSGLKASHCPHARPISVRSGPKLILCSRLRRMLAGSRRGGQASCGRSAAWRPTHRMYSNRDFESPSPASLHRRKKTRSVQVSAITEPKSRESS